MAGAVAKQQRKLEKNQGRQPDGRAAAKNRQYHFSDHRLQEKQKKRPQPDGYNLYHEASLLCWSTGDDSAANP